MDTTLPRILIMFLLLVLLSRFYWTETFQEVVAYNNTIVVDATQATRSTYYQETQSITDKIDVANRKNKNYIPLKPLDSGYSLYNKNIDFPLAKLFKTLLSDYLVKNNIFGKNVYISSDILNMYTKTTNGRSFVFDFMVVDPDTHISRSFKAQLQLDNIGLFVSNEQSYISPVNTELFFKNIHINFVGLHQDLEARFDPKDDLEQNFYEIKNKYFLLDPFATSGKDMIISKKMSKDFKTTLDEKSKSKSF